MTHYSVVVERETNGTFSAWVAGLPGVYAAADTASAAKRGLRSALAAHLEALAARGQTAEPRADVVVLRVDAPARTGRLRLPDWGPFSVAGPAPRRPKQPAAMASRVDGHARLQRHSR